jgi:hypothetical protein
VIDGFDHGLERLLLAPEFLRALGLVPDVRVFERGVDLVQAQRFALVVKDTPVAPRCEPRGPRAWCRSG